MPLAFCALQAASAYLIYNRAMSPLKTNALYYGDNLRILRDYVPDESIDLIYLDPPFNSNRSYNVLFKETSSTASQAQIEAFEDTWHWGKVAQGTFEEIALHGADSTARLLKAMVDALGHNDVTAYLTIMAVRLVELRRVLKPTGSIYLHCDPTASHYLKALMDSIFGPRNFRNEISWKRTNARSTEGRCPRVHDTLLFYTGGDSFLFKPLTVKADKSKLPHTLITGPDGKKYQTYELTGPGVTQSGESGKPWRGFDPSKMGRHWANSFAVMDEVDQKGLIHWARDGFPRRRAAEPFDDESRTVTVGDVWTDVDRINQAAGERLGYPTQKPLALLERVITASSNPGDVVLDPFCGCGTAIHAAHKLGRQWIGIDITHLAIGLVRRRMEDAFAGLKIEVVGEPVDLSGARELAAHDPFQFQWWALDKIDAQPIGDKRKGMDRGIDGIIPFLESRTDRKRAIVSVKGGSISSKDIRDLKGVLEREGEPLGVLLTLRPPTREMKLEAVAAGHYESPLMGRKYARIQILTIADILNGERVELPLRPNVFAQAEREREQQGEQGTLSV
jgi:site-specific DNA-methyltransferase (adenine-specific)